MARWDSVFSALIAVSAVSVAATYAYNTLGRSGSARESPLEMRLSRVSNPQEITNVGVRTGPDRVIVEVTEFSDLECPFCKTSHEAVRRLMERHPDDIAYVFVHYPLQNHAHALPAARAAECAREQGAFIEFVDEVFAQQSSLGAKPWTRLADEAGVADTLALSRCIEVRGEFSAISDGIALGQQLGVRGTPTVLINGWRFERAPRPADLERFLTAIMSGDSPLNTTKDTVVVRMN